jgi:hypothetical protein
MGAEQGCQGYLPLIILAFLAHLGETAPNRALSDRPTIVSAERIAQPFHAPCQDVLLPMLLGNGTWNHGIWLKGPIAWNLGTIGMEFPVNPPTRTRMSA